MNSEKILDVKFRKRMIQLVVSRSCLIVTEYTKKTQVGIKLERRDIYVFIQKIFMRPYNLFLPGTGRNRNR